MRALLMISTLLIASPAAAAPSGERAAILAAVQEFFGALEARSERRLLAIVVPEGRITAIQQEQAGAFRSQSWTEWAVRIARSPQILRERMRRPDVRIRGRLASVWTEYDFWRDRRYSHCGVDNFDMAKIDGRWRIVNLSFTVEPTGCGRR